MLAKGPLFLWSSLPLQDQVAQGTEGRVSLAGFWGGQLQAPSWLSLIRRALARLGFSARNSGLWQRLGRIECFLLLSR